MSGIVGLLNLSNEPADRTLLDAMLTAIAYRGPDGLGRWVEGPVALGHALLHTTPESLGESQPLRDESGTLVLTFDGRVDGREDLRHVLQSKGLPLRWGTDAELVLRAYQLWDEECPAHVLGDFAFAMWDGGKRRLFCARDALGVRPFYYAVAVDRFLFASELAPLLQDARVSREPNEGVLVEHLTDSVNDEEGTLFQGILRLPAAHCLSVGQGRRQKRRYWQPDPERRLECHSDQEFAEHFGELFRSAMCDRLRSHRPVAIELSGGVDSSSITAVAQQIQGAGSNRVQAFSLRYPGWDCDESEYIDAVVSKSGVSSRRITYEPLPRSYFVEQVSRYCDLPDYPNNAAFDLTRGAMAAEGIRVVLTGMGGDEWLWASPGKYADLLLRLSPVEYVRQYRADSAPPWNVPLTEVIFNYTLRQLMPLPLRRALKRMAGRRLRPPRWIPVEFARRSHWAERQAAQPDFSCCRSFVQRAFWLTLSGGFLTHHLEMAERTAARHGLEIRHPFHDRRLVEAAFVLPIEQRQRGQHTKWVLRNACRDLLPSNVIERRTKAEFSQLFNEALRALGGESAFHGLEISSLGWVCGPDLARKYRLFEELYLKGDAKYLEHEWVLWIALAIEWWYRENIAESGAPATATDSVLSANLGCGTK